MVGAGALAVALWLGTPALLRRLAFFRVRQVELVGGQHLPPEAGVAALRLPAGASGFEDLRPLAGLGGGLPCVPTAGGGRRVPEARQMTCGGEEPAASV